MQGCLVMFGLFFVIGGPFIIYHHQSHFLGVLMAVVFWVITPLYLFWWKPKMDIAESNRHSDPPEYGPGRD